VKRSVKFFDLEGRGNLIRVAKGVDVGWEVACLVKWMFQAVEEPNRRALWFENIAGHNIPVVTNRPVFSGHRFVRTASFRRMLIGRHIIFVTGSIVPSRDGRKPSDSRHL
jgi:3-polyprenyl-4-hydroxybenzoate decarboxylase